MTQKPLIMVFGSHSPQPGQPEYEEALELGSRLAQAGFAVASGGYGGTMEAVLRGAGRMGEEGVGYTAKVFPGPANAYVTREILSETLFGRIERIIVDSAGFIALKGGTGTLLELSACWELVNKKMAPYKPIVCLGEFWRPVVRTLAGEPSLENIKTLRRESHSAADYVLFAGDSAEAVRILEEKIGREK